MDEPLFFEEPPILFTLDQHFLRIHWLERIPVSASIARDRSLFESRPTWNDAVYLVVRLAGIYFFSERVISETNKNFKRIRKREVDDKL